MLHNTGAGEGSNQGLGRHVGSNPDDPDPWQLQNVLSFDGGGVRGLWSLFVLDELMSIIASIETIRFHDKLPDQRPTICSSFYPHDYPSNVSHENADDRPEASRCCRLPEQQRFLPCHYFDLICGSSTGALIAIMLGRLRMPVSDCILEYKNLGGEVFGNPRTFHAMNVPKLRRTKYSTTNFERVVKEFVDRRGDEGTLDEFELKSDLCRTMVTSWRTRDEDSVSLPFLLRSYGQSKRTFTRPSRTSTNTPFGAPSRRQTNQTSRLEDNPSTQREINRGRASRHEIWRVARAASAPPPFLAPMRLDQTSQYEDGGMGLYNNPTHEAIRDIAEMNDWSSIGSVVSVGTSRRTMPARSGILGLGRKMIDRATNPEGVHHTVMEQSINGSHPFDYWRFNAEPSNTAALSTPFDEWKPRSATSGSPAGARTISDIRNSFNAWLNQGGNQAALRECALNLVQRRRARSETKSRWARFATCHTFECPEGGCQNRRGDLFYEKDDFERHLIDQHEMAKDSKQLADTIWNSEKQWKYKRRA